MNRKDILTAMLALLAMSATAQNEQARENPRGIYKMIRLTGKLGEVKAPYEQYKICTDSITLMASMQDASFTISNNDNTVFNYTGDQPKDGMDKLIYDSNADHFTLKWWSKYANHLHFPKNDWCIEKYEANHFTENARMLFDALNVQAGNKTNPLYATWRVIGWMDELKGAKKQLATLRANYETSKYVGQYVSITPEAFVQTNLNKNMAVGMVQKCECPDKNTLKLTKTTSTIKWLSKDVIAIEEKIDYCTDWKILERVTDGRTMMSHIASQYKSKHK